MAKLNHVVVSRTFREAALYAEKNSWSPREWAWSDNQVKLMGLSDVTVHLMQETWNGFNVDAVNAILNYLRGIHQVNNIAIVNVVK